MTDGQIAAKRAAALTKIEEAIQEIEDANDDGYTVLDYVVLYHARSMDTSEDRYGWAYPPLMFSHAAVGLIEFAGQSMADSWVSVEGDDDE